MQLEMIKKNTENRQFTKQSHLVYLSSAIITILVLPLFIFVGSIPIIILNSLSILASISAVVLNKKKYYGLAALVFIVTITLQTFAETIFFGFAPGFIFYFFNLAVLTIFTNWKGSFRFIGVLIQGSLLILAFFLLYNQAPLYQMPELYIKIFLVINVTLNIIGVANSANYYMIIVKDIQKRLSKLAMTDYLTALPNRTAFSILFDEKIITSHEKQHPLSILMMDVDHFKQINDSHGHLCGDAILKQIAEILHNIKDQTDLIARYGGEEFIYVLPHHSLKEVKERAEFIRHKIESESFIYMSKTFQLTISIGALLIERPLLQDVSIYLDKADALLYKAKTLGRNCVVAEIFKKPS